VSWYLVGGLKETTENRRLNILYRGRNSNGYLQNSSQNFTIWSNSLFVYWTWRRQLRV